MSNKLENQSQNQLNNKNHSTEQSWWASIAPTCVTIKPLSDKKVMGGGNSGLESGYLEALFTQLQELKQQAKQAEIAKADFIMNMQHDIRTPFSGIYSLAQALQQQETNKKKKEALDCIVDAAKELLDYCNNIIDFVRIKSGTNPKLQKKFNLRQLIEQVVAMEQPAAKKKDLSLILNYHDDIPITIIGDDQRLLQILLNLLGNAIKFTEKGSVTLEVTIVKKPKNREIILLFLVEDTGIGIEEEKQEYIYEEFNRGTPSSRGLYKGLGLGLTVVKQFVAEMDGEIELTSTLGQGSCFTCIVPFKLPLN